MFGLFGGGRKAPALPTSAPVGLGAENWKELMSGNVAYVNGKKHATINENMPQHRKANSESQLPLAGIVACSDSRVVPELIFNQGLGRLFTCVTAGNIVDSLVIGSLEFAVTVLQVKLIVVMGHTRCGACIAAVGAAKDGTEPVTRPGLVRLVHMSGSNSSPPPPPPPPPAGHLEGLVGCLVPPARAAVESGAPSDKVVDETSRRNAIYGAEAIITMSEKLKERFEKGQLTVIAAQYDIVTGEVTPIHTFYPNKTLTEQGNEAAEMYNLVYN
uniref:Carbonic anhydrase n=1 Tax=Rhodosorus marinus TaxID=101924 RepID=A0A6T6KMR3_9RHOD|mmetsp:Transcript_12526/g.18160  ORF Transcript_12526/g.18160 Transcript_12526/m.18160 type:complete len:272 (+) Transcript_12526:184-999(+)|eukprot:CAMPEP_0184752264 /NCGR_PEP_ID=MMETSP0315-20130426/43485_1 /TAXON_ID=101924 /ORGANISM="Rhodosorus marinus, Strain UTEX LB 2760" /LENGTH=271 /DNA_ID=CAMNT_0027231583 /DNA_START=220 /DNA_END=1035 /DNA_ORIENTATION=-